MNSYQHLLSSFVIICFGIVCLSGCEEQIADKGKATKKPLPKMDFHKPDSFAAAVGRIREIHDVLVSEEDLPAPISYTVKEVSHSHGDGEPHIHYHLADEGNHEHCDCEHDHDHDDHDHDDHGHGHADPFQPTHRITVDIFSEFKDVSKWLPKIASDGDLSRDSWNAAKEVSEKISNHLDSVAGAGLPLVQRTNYQNDSSEMESWIQKLESLVEPAATTTENQQ